MLVVTRPHRNPVLSPVRERPWEAIATFNPSTVQHGDTTHLFYRAVARPDALLTPHAGASTIGHAVRTGSAPFSTRTQSIVPSESWDAFGCEDPRATFFEGKWYVFYTALGGFPFGPGNIKIAVACGDSPDHLSEKHLITPFNAKAGVLFPERIDGDVVLLLTVHTDWTGEHPRPTIAIARAKDISDFWSESYWNEWYAHLEDHALPDSRRKETDHVEVGAVPVKTEEGWLLVYSHIQNYYNETERIFGVEALLLDATNPSRILGRTPSPFLVPETSYELYGLVPNITFPTGTILRGTTLDIYYGAADTVCAVASLSLPDLLEVLHEEKRVSFVERAPHNPILSPREEHSWESTAVLNAAAVDIEGTIHLVYRAMGPDNTSVLGHATTQDGFTISERHATPLLSPREEFEQKKSTPTGNSGCEDPRIAHIGDTLYLCYTAYDGVHPTRGALTTITVDDFVAQKPTWSPSVLLTPEHVNDKDVCLFEGLVDGKAMILHRIDPNICMDQFDSLSFDREINRCIEIMGPRRGMWDSKKIGAAGGPIRVTEGWLFIYHGVDADGVYRLGAALLDSSGTEVRARTVMPILEPVDPWEKGGVVHNVVFSCGMVRRDDTLFLYWGGGDTVLCAGTLSVTKLVKKLLPITE